MNFYVYIIYSSKLDRYYTGHTSDLVSRIQQHNSGVSKFTSKATDWELCYEELFATRTEASKREREIKSKKSRKYIESLISKLNKD